MAAAIYPVATTAVTLNSGQIYRKDSIFNSTRQRSMSLYEPSSFLSFISFPFVLAYKFVLGDEVVTGLIHCQSLFSVGAETWLPVLVVRLN